MGAMEFAQLIEELQKQLAVEVPDRHYTHVTEFNECINKELYRAAYAPLHNLMHLGDWSPTKRLRELIEEFKVVF